jgi:hypothetical protein
VQASSKVAAQFIGLAVNILLSKFIRDAWEAGLPNYGRPQLGRKLAQKKNPPRPGGRGGPALATLVNRREKLILDLSTAKQWRKSGWPILSKHKNGIK